MRAVRSGGRPICVITSISAPRRGRWRSGRRRPAACGSAKTQASEESEVWTCRSPKSARRVGRVVRDRATAARRPRNGRRASESDEAAEPRGQAIRHREGRRLMPTRARRGCRARARRRSGCRRRCDIPESRSMWSGPSPARRFEFTPGCRRGVTRARRPSNVPSTGGSRPCAGIISSADADRDADPAVGGSHVDGLRRSSTPIRVARPRGRR